MLQQYTAIMLLRLNVCNPNDGMDDIYITFVIGRLGTEPVISYYTISFIRSGLYLVSI